MRELGEGSAHIWSKVNIHTFFDVAWSSDVTICDIRYGHVPITLPVIIVLCCNDILVAFHCD